MKYRILSLKLEIVYRIAKFTNRLSHWLCNKHSELYHEWKKEFGNHKGD